MPIAFDASASGPGGGSGPHTFSLTTTGSSILVFVGVLVNGDSDPTVTYNGQSLSALGTRTQCGTSGYYTQVFMLALGAGVGAQNVVVTAQGTTTDMYPIAASYSGCSQSNPPDSTPSSAVSDSLITQAFTTTGDNCWLAMITYNRNTLPMTAGSGTYLRQNNTFTGCQWFDSNGAKTPAGSYSLIADRGLITDIVASGVSFAPVAASGQFARPASTVAAGNWTATGAASLHAALSETSASDSDYITSGAAPSSDTVTIGLSSIAAPDSGTVTLRVRAKYV